MQPVTCLDNATSAPTTSEVIQLDTETGPNVYGNHVIGTTITGTPVALTVEVEGSVDLDNWYTLGTISGLLAVYPRVTNFQGKGAFYVRHRLTSLIGTAQVLTVHGSW